MPIHRSTWSDTLSIDLKELLETIGPTASLVFAAWIFLSYLQARFEAAAVRYRELLDEFREQRASARHDSVRRQILLYKRRCTWMRRATDIGVVSAMLLIATLVIGAINVAAPNDVLPIVAAVCAIVGLSLVIAAASLVLLENRLMQRALDDESTDVRV
jgi:uncharacterized membrane protein